MFQQILWTRVAVVDSETKTLRNTIKRKPRLLQCNKTSCITTELKLHFILHIGFHTFLFILVPSIWWEIKTMWILFLKPVFQEVIHTAYLWSGLALMSAIFRLDILRKPKYVSFPWRPLSDLLFLRCFFFLLTVTPSSTTSSSDSLSSLPPLPSPSDKDKQLK